MSHSTDTKLSILQQVEEILHTASAEDKQILSIAIESIKKKKESPYSTYLAGFLSHTGTFIDQETYQISLPITPFVMNPLQMVHGGITATLADSTMGSLVNKRLPDDKHCVTSEMKVNYISPGLGEELICQAKVVHMGKQLCVAECRVTTEKGRLVAIATGTFYVIKADR
jgi:uncharacterized protein (TIGR00369 family)